MARKTRLRRAQHGGVLISALAFVAISAFIVVGMLTTSLANYARATDESDYEAALALAEAGVNYEFRQISVNTANADQKSVSNPNGISYNLGSGTFTVFCSNKNGTTPWVAPNNLYVTSTGTVHGISRTIQTSVKGYSVTPDYGLFGVVNGIMNGTPSVIGGDVGTNGTLLFNGNPTLTGAVDFNGAGSNWQSPPNGGGPYTVNHLPNAVVWPTVSSIANSTVAGGLTTLATTNDNAMAVPPIVGNSVLINGSGTLTLKGKPGGANYYVTSLLLNGSPTVVFDNTNGPINLWQGPAGGNGTFIFNGGAAAIKNSVDSTKKVMMYIAGNNAVTMNGNTELDAGLYNYNGASSGTVTMNGSPAVYGSIIANKFIMNGNPTINYQKGYYQASGSGYYGYDDQWLELNGM